jgi:hypothetical protein
MEQTRWPKGGLNVDDSKEIVDPEDWTDAVNIVDGRSFNGKNGEKENVRGTSLLSEDLSINIIVDENNTFLDWLNSGTGQDWVLGAEPAVLDIPGESSSKRLTYTLPTPVTGWFPVIFKYSVSNLNEAPIVLYCLINNGAEEIASEPILSGNGELSFLFNSATPILSVSIYFTTGVSNLPAINSAGGGPDFETNPLTWGFAPGFGTTSQSSLYKTSGNYSLKYKHGATASPATSTTRYAMARMNAVDVPTGKRIYCSVNVYTPSSNQIDQNAFELFLEPYGFGATFDVVSFTNKTVASCINSWQTVEAVFDVTNPASSQVFVYVAIKDPMDINEVFTLSEGEIYVDEFYVTGDATPQSLSLSDVLIQKNVAITDIIDGESRYVGHIRSAKDDVNYIFFYNTNPDKHCIVKLQSDTLSLVLAWSGFGFSPLKKHRIQGGIADELLYFTDNINPPRCVHENRYASGSVPDTAEEILWIKRGPLAPPLFAKQTTSGYIVINDDLQFATQFIYIDGQQSVLSPFTRLCRKESLDESFNDVLVTLDPSDPVPSNVIKIKYIVKKGNNGTPVVFSERVPSSEAPVTFHIGTEGEVVESMYFKLFENVPHLAKTAAISKSRAWLGNYIEGYDTPTDITIDYEFEASEFGEADEGPAFEGNSSRKLGALLYDESGRTCGVIPLKDSSGLDAIATVLGPEGHESNRRKLKFRLQGTPPTWAKRWSLVVTDDLIKTFFLSGMVHNETEAADIPLMSTYVIVDEDDVETYHPQVWQDENKYIRINIESLNRNGYYYSHKPGDQLIITDLFLGGWTSPLEIIKQVGSFIYVPAQNIGNLTVSNSNRYQIFTPRTASTGAYYEIGHSEPIVSGAFDEDYSTWEGSSVHVAYSPVSPTSMIAQMSFHKDGTWNTDAGRISVVTELGQVYKKNFFKCSSPFISGINVNGLSEFNVGDEKSTSLEAGEIQKLQPTSKESTEGDIILAICNSDTFSVYIDETRVATGTTTFLVASANVIGDVRKQKSGYGTLHPESVHEEDGYVYMFDKLSRSFLRYATNGLFPISEYKMVDFFEAQAKLNAETDAVVCGYDPFYKLIFVTFTNAATERKRTLAFSPIKDRWTSWFDFAPDAYIVGSEKMYSIVGGNIYKHDNEELFNNFYGEQFNSEIDVSFNDSPDAPKEWRVIQVHSSPNLFSFEDGVQVVPVDTLKVDLSNRKGQAIDIFHWEMEVEEDLIYADIKCDMNSDGGPLDGVPMYSPTLQAKITFSGITYKQIFLVKVGFEPSKGHIL